MVASLKHPERITAIISRNGHAYEVGLSEDWNPVLAYWQDPTPANREALLPAGAEAFKRDIPNAVIGFFDTGHFAPETHAPEIAAAIREFLA